MLSFTSLLAVVLAIISMASCSHIPRLHAGSLLSKRGSNTQYQKITTTIITTGVSYSSTNIAQDIETTGITAIMPGLTMTFDHVPAYFYLETVIPVTYTTTVIKTTSTIITASSTKASSPTSSTTAKNTSNSKTTTTTFSKSTTTSADIPVVTNIKSGWSVAEQSAAAKCFIQGKPQDPTTPQIISSSNLNITDCYTACITLSTCKQSVYNAAENVCMLLGSTVAVTPAGTNIWFALSNSGAVSCYNQALASATVSPSVGVTSATSTTPRTSKAI